MRKTTLLGSLALTCLIAWAGCQMTAEESMPHAEHHYVFNRPPLADTPDRERYGEQAWEVHPQSPWNVGLLVDREDPHASFRVVEGRMPDYPWDPDAVPIQLIARGRQLPQWQEYNASAGPLPYSPTVSDEPVQELVLIPYGASTLRISVFPVLRQ